MSSYFWSALQGLFGPFDEEGIPMAGNDRELYEQHERERRAQEAWRQDIGNGRGLPVDSTEESSDAQDSSPSAPPYESQQSCRQVSQKLGDVLQIQRPCVDCSTHAADRSRASHLARNQVSSTNPYEMRHGTRQHSHTQSMGSQPPRRSAPVNQTSERELDKFRAVLQRKMQELQDAHHHLSLYEQDRNNLLRHIDGEARAKCEIEEKNKELLRKIEELEGLHAQHAQPESGSYQDSAATPPLLQSTADAVNEAIAVCASEFFAAVRKALNMDALQAEVPIECRSNMVAKACLQGVLCTVLFQRFEDPYFFLRKDHLPPFQTPSERKQELFQAFKRCRDFSDAKQLLRTDEEFHLFFRAKMGLMNREIKARLVASVSENLAAILDPESANNLYVASFLRAAKCVWVLHKLSMAFEPTAQIFRVGYTSVLNETYMEDVAAHDDDAEGNENAKVVKRVLVMRVPGFTVRHTVIRSRVFCLSFPSDEKTTTPAEAAVGTCKEGGATDGTSQINKDTDQGSSTDNESNANTWHNSSVFGQKLLVCPLRVLR